MNNTSINGTTRILLVEDNLGDARLLQEMLAEVDPDQFALTHVLRLHQALECLKQRAFAAILLDLTLPDGSGMETITRVRTAVPDVPIVVLTGLSDESFAVSAVREGAQDYLVKGQIDGLLLVRALRYAMERHRLLYERQRAEHILAEERNLLRTLIDNLPDLIYAKDRDGRFVLSNQSHVRLLGQPTAEALVGKTVFDCFPREVALAYDASDQSVIQSGQPVCDREEPAINVSGKQRWLATTKVPLRNGLGDIVGLVGISRDITERRQLEEQLRQAQKMEAIGQLAGGVAHDFNNILTVIRGRVSLALEERQTTPEIRDSLQEIGTAAERAANLTRQLLSFSRRQVMQIRVLDLNEVIENLAKMLHRLLGEHIALEFRYGSHLPALEADQGMIEQVIMNLSVNARDAMPQGGCLIISSHLESVTSDWLQRYPEARLGSHLCLSVADTGCGMDERTLARIFEPFFTTKEPGKGTGLGLATVYGIVKQHGGWIEVDSKVNQGTTFKVYLPASNKTKDALAPKSSQSAELKGKETILVVEDDGALRMLVRDILRRQGYRVLEAPTGLQALNVWTQEAGKIDLLLTDMVMPEGISGRELAARLVGQKAGLKVIYTSGYSASFVGKDLALRDGETFLQKPYPAQALIQLVRQCLDGKG